MGIVGACVATAAICALPPGVGARRGV